MVKIDIFRHGKDDGLRVPAGTKVFREGDAARTMYAILEGTVEVRVQGVKYGEMGEGEVFGEMALIGDHRRSATVVAISDCVLAEISEKRFEFLVQQHPRFALQIMRVLAERLVARTTPAETAPAP